jgi:hypothetical protein
MARRLVPWWTFLSLTLAALALARLAEGFLKRELTRRSATLRTERVAAESRLRDALNRRDALRVDYTAAVAQSRVAPEETYLVLRKGQARGQVMMGSKAVYDFRFRVRGSVPLKVKGQIPEMPEGVLTVQVREDHANWYRPDWLYEQAGRAVPGDSAERMVADAFGRYAILLGGGVAIHGPASRDVPADAVDHVYAELSDRDLKAVYNAVKEGSRVLIQH